jgi:hypothetical protein
MKDEKMQTVTIVVRGREVEVEEKELSFEDIVRLAFDVVPTGSNVVITVTYFKGEHDKKEGELLPTQTVKVKKGMVFNVTATDKS